MIKINKPSQAPAILLSTGTQKAADHCTAYLAHKAEYDAGKRKFPFDAALYGHQSVKNALTTAQKDKCVFCERKIGADGDIEHFRPKSGFREKAGSPLQRPGYYWLAYDWDNLLFSCPICNQRYKKNFFPLADPAKRARMHTDDVTQETPLFLNPSLQDPADHLSFRAEIPFAVNASPQAKATIQVLGLGRAIYNEVRRDRLKMLHTMYLVVAQEALLSGTPEGRQLLARAKAILMEAVTDTAEFAAMARAAIKSNFAFVLL